MEQIIFRKKEAAEYLRCSTRTLDRRVSEKQIRSGNDGRVYFFKKDLDAYLDRYMPLEVVGVIGGTVRRRRS